MPRLCALATCLLLLVTGGFSQSPQSAAEPAPAEGDYIAHNFHFQSGETLPELRLHYTTFGKPQKDASGKVTNAVLILHGTGGTGHQFLAPQFADVLFGSGQLLDATRYFIILPDNIGHGKSSKPSDGLHAHFPQYDYDDMVAAQHELLEKGLGVNHLRLVMGTSMGCMHSWVWGETYPDFMDALMPLACLPVQIAGRNRLWRKMVIDGIRQDPDWKNGDYTTEPRAALQISADFLLIAGSAPLPMQKNLPTRDAADKYLDDSMKRITATLDANDMLYAVNSSRNYDPSPKLEIIQAPVMFVNSADDFINPRDLDIAEREIKRVKLGKFVLIPASEQTHGHGTHTWAAIWQQYLKELLESSLQGTAAPLAQTSDWNQYVTGMTVVGRTDAGPGCPPIVWIVDPDTPAAKVGIQPGDRLLSIDGRRDLDIIRARPLLRTADPTPTTIEFEGEKGPYKVSVGRIKASELYTRQGLKPGPDGSLFPADATDAEMLRVSKIQSEPPRDKKVFNVSHYPRDLSLYYPGFELFVWDEPQRIMVGGIEDGPGQRAGVHYGDTIVSVNGVDPVGKSMPELEKLFSSQSPATQTLVVDRDGIMKTFTFRLEKASDVASLNVKRRFEERMIPSAIPDAYLHCWSRAATKP